MRARHHPEGRTITIIRSDAFCTRSEFPHPLVTLDYDARDTLTAVTVAGHADPDIPPLTLPRCRQCGCLDAIACTHRALAQPDPGDGHHHAAADQPTRPRTCSWAQPDLCTACDDENHLPQTAGWTHPPRAATDAAHDAILDHHRTHHRLVADPDYFAGYLYATGHHRP